MKSKLILLALTGALALGASAPQAMASPAVGNHTTPRPNFVTRQKSRAVTKKVGANAPKVNPNARPSHATK